MNGGLLVTGGTSVLTMQSSYCQECAFPPAALSMGMSTEDITGLNHSLQLEASGAKFDPKTCFLWFAFLYVCAIFKLVNI